MSSYESFYSGGYSSLDPAAQGFVGYRMPISQIAMATDPRIANIVKETSNKLNTGAKNIEISQVTPDVFESIPDQYFEEIKRANKLIGAGASLHAPVVDPSGFTQQGWNENNREAVERQFSNVLDKAHKMDPNGNIPVVFHSTSLPGTEYSWNKDEKKLVPMQMVGVEQETGQLNKFKREEVYYLGQGKEMLTPEERMNMHNTTQWKNSILGLDFNKKEADELLNNAKPLALPVIKKLESLKTKEEMKEFVENLAPQQRQALNNMEKASGMLQHIEAQVQNIYEDAVKYADPDPRLSKEVGTARKKQADDILKSINKDWEDFARREKEMDKQKNVTVSRDSIQERSDLLDTALEKLGNLTTLHVVPQKIIPLEDFAKKKASETFSSVALKSYKDFGGSAPIIAIENPPAGGAISSGTQLKELVEETRKKFVDKAVQDGIGRGEAESAAKKLIGATWDVGHINMLRKYGADKEFLVEETGKIAPFVKHVHLSDNFGFEHTELPMGMGNVPIKAMMEKLGEEGFEGKKVIEAGNWWQHFSEQGKISALGPTLEAFGSPIYGMAMSPYWNQASGTVGGYSAGFGAMLPDQHFSMYGAGFEQLPLELGGQVAGKNSRFSGAPMD